jgi:Zn-dependent protease with chaperone function
VDAPPLAPRDEASAGTAVVTVALFGVSLFGIAAAFAAGLSGGWSSRDGRLAGVSLIVGLAGVWLWRVMAAAGRRALRDARHLLAFDAWLRTTIVTTSLLTIGQAIVVAEILRRFGASPYASVTVLVGAALVAALLVRAWRGGVLSQADVAIAGLPVPHDAAPWLWGQIDDIARRVGVEPPDHVVVGHDAVFFVTPLDVVTPFRRTSGRTLFCSLPLMRVLSVPEVRAVIAHELAHFAEDDRPFTVGFYPRFRAVRLGIASLRGPRRRQGLLLLPALAIVECLLDHLAPAAAVRGRVREAAADAAAAAATSPRALAAALAKVTAWAPLLADAVAGEADVVAAGQGPPRIVERFAAVVAARATPSWLSGRALDAPSHPTDAHPPLSARLEGVGLSLEAILSDALDVEPRHRPPAAEMDALEATLVAAALRDLGVPAISAGR